MKKALFTLIMVSIISVSCDSTTSQPETKAVQEYKNETIETIHNRKSVRAFTPKIVSDELLLELVKAGMAAPTGRDIRPWEFVILTDREQLDILAKSLPYAKMLANAPAAIVVSGNPDPKNNGSSLWVMDCSAATQNILLAAESLGLGAVWTATHPYKEREDAVINAVSLPSHLVPLCIIPIGYPKGEQTSKKKFDPTKVKYNTY